MLTYIILGLVLIILIFIWVIYNRLVSAKNIVHEAYSGIDVQLKKRFELIPNLIEAVKGYNQHEAELLKKIVVERVASGQNVDEMAQNDASITSALKNFRVQVEAYPDLKANTQFLKLMDNLCEVEDELAMARRYYNGTTRDNNIKMESFPTNVFASMFGFKNFEFYKVDEQAKSVPEFDLNK